MKKHSLLHKVLLLIVLVVPLYSSEDPNFFAFEPNKKQKTKTQPNQTNQEKNNTFDPFFAFKETEKKNISKENETIADAPPLIIHPKKEQNPETTLIFSPEQTEENVKNTSKTLPQEPQEQTILINFNNVGMAELLRFISRVSNKNFYFDEKDVQFNVTIVSEEPTSIENVLTALFQELRVHNLELIEQGNNFIIHKNPKVNGISRVVSDSLTELAKQNESEIITRVFRLNTLDPQKAASVVRPLVSQQAIVDPVVDPNNLIVTDLETNVNQIAKLLKSLDSPNNGLVIGQYAVKSMTVPNMQKLTQEIMDPIAQGQTLIFVPHTSAKTLFIIASPYLVERTLLMMKYIDKKESATQIHDLEKFKEAPKGNWQLDINGNWIFTPGAAKLKRKVEIGDFDRWVLVPETNEVERLLPENQADRDALINQIIKDQNILELGRDFSRNEALFLDKFGKALSRGEIERDLTENEMELMKKLKNELSQGELSRELTEDELLLLKKLQKNLLDKELQRDLTPEEGFFANKFLDKLKARELEREKPPEGRWLIDKDGNWVFLPEGESTFGFTEPSEIERGLLSPEGIWEIDDLGNWTFKLAPGERISARELNRKSETSDELPIGDMERTKFFIMKLQNRKGDEIVYALENIAYSLESCGRVNDDLICAINSVQWIESSNSLIFTGLPSALDKVRELVAEIDAPLRQVFLEMLILETDVDDSLTYGVNWASRFGGGDTTGSQAFLTAGSPLASGMDTTGSNLTPTANTLARQTGFTQGVIGQSLSKDGVLYRSLGALVQAVQTNTTTRIVMNPKIIVEDNQEAEIFVGINTRYKTQSIANNQGELLTNNFEYRDVGTTLRITPMIGNNDVITLDIFQETSSVLGGQGGGSGGGTSGGGTSGGGNSGQVAEEATGPTTRLNKTITRVHVPNKYFLVISGMMQDEDTITRSQVPCLGGVPVIGALFANRDNTDLKRNLMIFIRPEIIDTIDDIQHLTKHQQDIYKTRDCFKKSWRYGMEQALDFLNIPELYKPCCIDECN